jgi:hypothetical protein
MRGLFMLLLIIGFTVGQWLLNLLALVQFLWLLFARAPNEFLARFGSSLAIWLADVGRVNAGVKFRRRAGAIFPQS